MVRLVLILSALISMSAHAQSGLDYYGNARPVIRGDTNLQIDSFVGNVIDLETGREPRVLSGRFRYDVKMSSTLPWIAWTKIELTHGAQSIVWWVKNSDIHRHGNAFTIAGRDIRPPQPYDLTGTQSSEPTGERIPRRQQIACRIPLEELRLSRWRTIYRCYGVEVHRDYFCAGERTHETTEVAYNNQISLQLHQRSQGGQVIASIQTPPTRVTQTIGAPEGRCIPMGRFDPSSPATSLGSVEAAAR